MIKIFASYTSLLFLLCFSLKAKAQIDGIPKDLHNKIKASQPELLQKPYSPRKWDQLLKQIQLLSNAEKVFFNGSNENPSFTIHSRPKFGSFKFSGITQATESELRNLIDLQIGDTFTRNKINEAAKKIKSYYINRGYLQAEIEIQTNSIKDKEGFLSVDIKIDPNDPTEISKIEIISSNERLNRDLEDELSSFEDESLNDLNLEGIQKKISEYLKEERYLKASPGENQVSLNDDRTGALVRVEILRPQKYELSFFGQQEISKSKLIDGLDLESPTNIFSENLSSELSQKIKATYRKNGFESAEVKIQEIPQKNANVLRFQIIEGAQTRIVEWQISGSYSREKDYYLDQMESLGSDKIRDEIYVKEDLEEMLKSLNVYLQNQGYLSSKVELEKTEFVKENSLKVIVRIDEGPISILKQVQFLGAEAFSKEELLEVIELKEGTPLNLNHIEDSIKKLKNFYLEKAHLDYELLNEKSDLVIYSNQNKEASLNFKIKEGDKIKVKEVLVSGNIMTKKTVIIKTLAFEKDDFLSLSKINESEFLLQRLGIFSTVDIQPLPANDGNRPVLVKVTERNPGVFTLGLGVTDEFDGTLKGFTGLVYKNLGGSAKVVQARVEIQNQINNESFIENKVTLSYLEPLLFGRKLKGRTNLSFSQDIDFLSSDAENTYIKESKEINFVLEKDYDQHTKIGWKLWEIEGTRRFETNQKADQEKLQIGSIGPYIELDYRDHLFSPRQGSYTRFAIEYASPGYESSEDIHFGRATAVFNHYLPLNLSKRLVFAYSLRGGYVENLGRKGTDAVPQDRMFFLGGRSTIRGFELAEIPNETDIDSLKPNGSSIYYVSDKSSFGLVKLELRFPIYDDFGAAIFYDGGAVNIPEIDLPSEYIYRDSMGISFRFYTPVGPVSLEYGHKLNRRDGESPGRFHFSIGAF